jgi:predicted site-specific integrase-resolvase
VAQGQRLTIAYSRVSGVAQKPDLAQQIAALKAYCEGRQMKVDEWMQDIGSGLNYNRKQFGRLGGLRSYKDVLREAALYKEEDR